MNGQNIHIANQFVEMLRDDYGFAKVAAAKAHLETARYVLDRGVSKDDFQTWFGTPDPYNNNLPGHGGVVCMSSLLNSEEALLIRILHSLFGLIQSSYSLMPGLTLQIMY